MKIYLAGPDVFLNDFGASLFVAKKALCSEYGFVGVSPMDGEIDVSSLARVDRGVAIYAANAEHMRQCDATIANMTPFRGVSMDVGTAFEMGYMAARGRPVLGYTNSTEDYEQRAERYYRAGHHYGVDAYSAGTSIETFDMADNLMMVGAVHMSGFEVVRSQVAPGREWDALDGFKECLRQLKGSLGRS